MSGLQPTGIRSSEPNTFYFAPYTGEHLTTPKSRKLPPRPYSPVYRRTRAGTKYDVRATYPANHTLRNSFKVTKAVVKDTMEGGELWRRSRSSGGNNNFLDTSRTSSRNVSQDTPMQPTTIVTDRGFLPPDTIAQLPKPNIDHTLSTAACLEALEADELAELWTVLRKRIMNRMTRAAKRKALSPLKWVKDKVVEVVCANCTVAGVDRLLAGMSIVSQHRSLMCSCEDESFWIVHGIEGKGFIRFSFGGPREECAHDI
jgi:hypothetical protein